jgi:hypothetical protein
MDIKFGKNFKCFGNWTRVELSPEEEHELQQELRKMNIDIMKECLHDAKELLCDNCRSMETRLTLATALFNKRAQQSYTLYQALLDNLVQQIKRKEKEINKNA